MTGYNTWGNSWGVSWGVSWGTGAPAPSVTGGHFLPIYEHGKRKHTLSNIQIVYDKARKLPRNETKELREIISEFVEPAIAGQAKLPEIIKIDYEMLAENQLAYERFIGALNNIQNNIVIIEKRHQEDDELLLLTVFACTIN